MWELIKFVVLAPYAAGVVLVSAGFAYGSIRKLIEADTDEQKLKNALIALAAVPELYRQRFLVEIAQQWGFPVVSTSLNAAPEQPKKELLN